jgi:hypothetical protein
MVVIDKIVKYVTLKQDLFETGFMTGVRKNTITIKFQENKRLSFRGFNLKQDLFLKVKNLKEKN